MSVRMQACIFPLMYVKMAWENLNH